MRSLTLALGFVTAVGALPACYHPEEPLTYEVPPPPREEVVVARPGSIWVHGRWVNNNGYWVWHGGHYERERPGYHYVEGRWEKHHHQHVWVEGHWET